ncbi:glycosyl transferase family 2 [Breznakia blatticola]|uniref:Glycosyl transferase family 2 n=1 Tax=Breznakia blatticola TaxID=1754012 RepID=A0A4R7ZAH8_9FIRM|nr:glycosyltransferase family A protein [Breznakia blatticola]TDW13955.1 glycosyl transferase family 2 [Breznakia blatticola]
MNIEVLMSTMKRSSINELKLKEKNISTPLLVVNQLADSDSHVIEDECRFFSYTEKGLSRSRNILLKNAKGDVGIITDDDITFIAEYKTILCNAYEKHPEAGIITFNLKIGDDTKGWDKEFTHTFWSLMSVASCQISIKPSVIRNLDIHFNESFGLGASFKSGEENLFLNDCRKKGVTIIHVPITLCSHPHEDTTGELWSADLVKSKGALSTALLGKKHVLFLLYFILVKHKEYKKTMKIKEFYRNYMNGVHEYRSR